MLRNGSHRDASLGAAWGAMGPKRRACPYEHYMVHTTKRQEGERWRTSPAGCRLPVLFYRADTGNEPVREWLRDLDPDDRKAVGTDLLRVQEQWPIGMPVCRSIGRGLWEVRTDLSGNRTARVLFFVADGRIGALHGFIKKTRKTPKDDIDLALKRMREMKE